MSSRRIAITGIGLLTPCGRGWKPYWEAVTEGISPVSCLSPFALPEQHARIAGQFRDFNRVEFVKQKKSLKLMSRESQIAGAASFLALEDAGSKRDTIDCNRFG